MQTETRKLQKVGGSTYTVSVPKYWADRYDLHAGSEVHLYTYGDGTLVVRSTDQAEAALGTATVTCDSGTPQAVERGLRAAYEAGFETVELVTEDEFSDEQRRRANATAMSLVGMQVVTESPSAITVRSLLDASEVSVRQSVIQLQFLTQSMHGVATQALVDDDATAATALDEQESEVDRLVSMTGHHFNRSLSNLEEADQLDLGRPKLFDYYLTANYLARIADNAVTVTGVVAERDADLPEDVASELRGLAFDTRQLIDRATGAVVNGFSTDDAVRAFDDLDDVTARADAIDRVLFDHGPEGTYYLTEVTRALVGSAEYAGEIASVAYQGAIREQNARQYDSSSE